MKTVETHKTTNEVRQGDRHKTNFRVLIISMTVVIVAFAILYAVYALTQSSPA